MNRLLTLASGGLFATGLAILPISAFAQQNATDGKTVAPVTQTGSTDAKISAPGVKIEPAAKQAVAAKDATTHRAKGIVTHAVKPAKVTVPTTHSATSVHPSSNLGTVQPKAADQSKS
jgi:hypothetical protein